MTSSHFSGPRSRWLLTLLASAAVATSGCSNMASTATGGADTPNALKLGGKIHGGNQPVSGATVNLYFSLKFNLAGTPNGGAALVATTTSSSDGNGSFSFQEVTGAPNDGTSSSFSCPTTNGAPPRGLPTNPYVFVVAKGGTTVNTPGATPNSDAEFIAPLGRCNDLTNASQVYMSEVVTVATMAAMHQYMNPTNAAAAATPIESTLGSEPYFVADQALTDAFNGVNNLIDISTGLGRASIVRPGIGVNMTVTPELAKINQLANIISSCVNQSTSGSAACQAIYAAAAPPASAASTSVPSATFAPATDLLTALYYIFTNPTNGSTANLTTLYNLAAASGAPYQPTLTAPPTDWSIGVAFTSSGTCNTTGQPFFNNPTEITTDISGTKYVTNGAANGGQVSFSALGYPLACQTVANASGLVYDADGNTWTGNGAANTITRYGSGLASNTVFTTAAPVKSITANGFGDVFFSTTAGNLYEIPNGSTASGTTVPVKINSISIGSGSKILIDTNNTVWASSGANYITATVGTPSPTGAPTTLTFGPNATTQTAVAQASIGVAPTSNTHTGVYSVSSAPSVQALGGSVTPFTTNSGGGMNSPNAIALDGAQNAWVANGVGSSISGFDITGAALTPSTGYIKSSLGGQNTIFIDSSGNIWVGLTGTSTIVEIVGSAVPVFQPYSNGLDPTTPRYGQIP